ncbi:conserved hypothetical protein [Gammaproteobacteria bacterium]
MGDFWWMSGKKSWKPVAVPDAAFSWVPFTVQKKGRTFRINPSFDLLARSGITVTKTYYVDKTNGNDTNSGLDWAHALKTLYEVNRYRTDADRIYIRAGYYYYNETWSWPLNRNIQIIGDGGVYLTNDVGNEIGAFSASGNHYVATVGGSRTVLVVNDRLTLDAYGAPTRLVKKASEAEVDATAGTWWQNGTTIYVRGFSDRAPDTSLYYTAVAGNIIGVTYTDRTYYLENIILLGGINWVTSAPATAANLYVKNCSIYGPVLANGQNEIIMQDVNVLPTGPTGDALNYSPAGGGPPSNVAEINVKAHNLSSGGSDQASTGHLATVIVRVGGEYFDSSGQNIADVSGCKTWVLGSLLHGSRTALVGFYSGGTAWLDSVTISNNPTDIQNEAACATYVRNLISGGHNIIAGTLTTY